MTGCTVECKQYCTTGGGTVYSSRLGLQRDVVYLDWPIKPSYMSPNAGVGGGRGGCGVSANEYSCIHRSPNKLWRSNSLFYLWFTQRQVDRISPYFCNMCSFVAHVHYVYLSTMGFPIIWVKVLYLPPVCSIYVDIWIPPWICWLMIRMTVVVYVVYCLTYLKENNKYMKKLSYFKMEGHN